MALKWSPLIVNRCLRKELESLPGMTMEWQLKAFRSALDQESPSKDHGVKDALSVSGSIGPVSVWTSSVWAVVLV